ncbi:MULTISPECIES: TonB-dependent receptor [unclassified Massilia]|uniref:TonB-dependent receptor n=1 Tax=unclassified Massilia TaxID=2609279 RepID=UPI00177F4CF0|nr:MULTISPECIES: TonB-dependent receptor [unclassified Massilia]MBD8529952.1 TonB-dependent receptor [Massilia sp. CFBP 13647]MBD8673851.1 TonB-dependent receptor [Massilia sp. CFBP 13721]
MHTTRHARAVLPAARLRHIALGAMALVAATQAHAQTQAQAQPQAESTEAAADNVVVVKGFRESLNNALNIKKNSDGIIDIIKAEDVSKFPDANLAESMQRVPGVSVAQGDGGEGKQITVRGLNAGFTRVRINGIEGTTATGASDINGSTNRGRAFDFSVFSAELFNSLAVRKTSEAGVEEGSLGATVDLRTARPFDFKGRTASIGAQGLYNTISKKTEPRLTALYSNRWDTPIGKVGALVSLAYAKRNAIEEGYEAVDIVAASVNGGFCSPLGAATQYPLNNAVKGIDARNCGFGVPRSGDLAAYSAVMGRRDDFGGTVASPAAGSGSFHPRIPRYRRSQTEYERAGITSTLQWRPDRATELNLDVMGGRYSNKRYDNYIQAISFGRDMVENGKGQTSIVDARFDDNGRWTYGKFNGVDIRSEALVDVYTTLFRQGVLSARRDITERLAVDLMLGVSDSRLNNPQRTTVQIDAPNVNGFSWEDSSSGVPRLDFGMDVSNPNNFSFGPQGADGTVHGNFVGRYLRTANRLKTSSANVSYQLTDNLTLRSGLSARRNRWFNYEVPSGGIPTEGLPPGVSLASLTRQLSGFGSGLGGNAPSSWAAVDMDKFLAVYNVECHCADIPLSEYVLANQVKRQVDEKIDALYLSGDFKFDAWGLPLRGNLGVRGAETRTVAMQLIRDPAGQLVPRVVEHSYRDWLPAFNVTATLPKDLLVRFSAGKTLSRAEYVDLSPSASINLTGQSVSIGNPTLDPIRANTVDLQAEWYYAKNAMISAGFFHKDIKTFIQRTNELMTYAETGLSNAYLTSTGCSITGGTPVCQIQPDTQVNVSQMVNTKGGPLDGFEFNWQTPFSFLPGAWSNFGALANYTHVKSKITYITRVDNPRTPANEQLTEQANFIGLSPDAYNLTIYYEDKKFSARVSATHRSSFIRDVLRNANGSDHSFAVPSTRVGLSMSYNVSPQLRLSFEAQNLTDEPLRYGKDTERDDTLLYGKSGRSYVLGANYKF